MELKLEQRPININKIPIHFYEPEDGEYIPARTLTNLNLASKNNPQVRSRDN